MLQYGPHLAIQSSKCISRGNKKQEQEFAARRSETHLWMNNSKIM